MICPEHIDGFVVKLPNKNKYFDYDFCDFNIPYEVKCSCGCEEFRIYKNSLPYVYVVCEKCKQKLNIYDLNCYPSASVIPTNEEPKEFKSADEESIFNVSVIYEYSDEFSFEDAEFDKNDITWCHVYGYGVRTNKVFEIIDDETA